jgi:predicted metal-dependent phosphoesterase TrpH
VSELWSSADIHIHTVASDGHNTVAQVLDYTATCTDLRVIAITDHDTITAAMEARRIGAHYGIDVIVGEEVSTLEGHLLALFIERELPPARPAAETIAAIHAQGGVCIAAHPYNWLVASLGAQDKIRRYAQPGGIWPLDGIETLNASSLLASMNTQAARAAEDLGLPACGGSDSHHLATIGAGVTRFPGHSAEDLRRAILARQTAAAGHGWGARALAAVAGLRARRTLARFTPNIGTIAEI